MTAAAALVTLLERYADSLGDAGHPLLGAPTCTPVLIAGGEAPNAVPERCRITLDRRMLPGETRSPCWRRSARCSPSSTRAAMAPPRRWWSARPAPAALRDPRDHPFVGLCRRALAAAGADDTLGGLTVNCDMTHFAPRACPRWSAGRGGWR
ncbi:peptidase dimerization domain-containing protein [Streptomyces sp. M19]